MPPEPPPWPVSWLQAASAVTVTADRAVAPSMERRVNRMWISFAHGFRDLRARSMYRAVLRGLEVASMATVLARGEISLWTS